MPPASNSPRSLAIKQKNKMSSIVSNETGLEGDHSSFNGTDEDDQQSRSFEQNEIAANLMFIIGENNSEEIQQSVLSGAQIEEVNDDQEVIVSDGAFWHVQACLDNFSAKGLDQVEIVHAPGKFWLARIGSTFGALAEMFWIGVTDPKPFWHDLKTRPCYPVGWFRRQQVYRNRTKSLHHSEYIHHALEPPSTCSFDPLIIQSLVEDYYKELSALYQSASDSTPDGAALCREPELPLRFRYLQSAPFEIFKVGDILEVLNSPIKVWFAKILENVGGRLKLSWVKSKQDIMLSSMSANNSTSRFQNGEIGSNEDEHFWLYFCHPRVQVVGYGCANKLTYECPEHEDLAQVHKLIDQCLEYGEGEEADFKREILESCRREQPQLYSQTNGKTKIASGDKVIVFSLNRLQICPATVRSVKSQCIGLSLDDPSTLTHPSVKSSTASPSLFYPYDDSIVVLPFTWVEENDLKVLYSDGAQRFHFEWREYLQKTRAKPAPIESPDDSCIEEFTVNSKVEVVHPDDPDMICEGIIVHRTPPLIWIAVSTERVAVLPFYSTDIFPCGWCMRNGYQLSELLPKKPPSLSPSPSAASGIQEGYNMNDSSLTERLASNLLCNENKSFVTIYFNHKCFTGPSLSKSKICQLPKYVGPGPVILVLQEVISKILCVAYVPNRVLNELSSTTLHDLLVAEGLSASCQRILFKAKYQKRTYRDHVPITLDAARVEHYCRTVCEHLKCCYNLFGPNLYDGDDCPAHCRHLTKSNKYMRRPLFYREQAKLGLVFNGKDGIKDKSYQKKKRFKKPYGGTKKKPKSSNAKPPAALSSVPSINNIHQPVGGIPTPSTRSLSTVNYDSKPSVPDSASSDNIRGQFINHSKPLYNHSPQGDVLSSQSQSADDEFDLKNNSSPLEQFEDESTEDGETEEFEEDVRVSTPSPKIQCANDQVIAEAETPVNGNGTSDITAEQVNRWTVDDVHNYLKNTESAMFANILREQEVDGAAFILLDYDVLKGILWSRYNNRFHLSDLEKLSTLIQSIKKRSR